jgi:hypothetical protein
MWLYLCSVVCVCVYLSLEHMENSSVLKSIFRNEQSLPYNHNLSKLFLVAEKTKFSFFYSSFMYVDPKQESTGCSEKQMHAIQCYHILILHFLKKYAISSALVVTIYYISRI